MKKDRNCGGNSYPVYPTYPGMMAPGMMAPNMPIPMPPTYGYAGAIPANNMMPTNQSSQYSSSNTVEQQLNQMQQQINNLDRRVTRLENNTSTNNTTSFGSNYQMM